MRERRARVRDGDGDRDRDKERDRARRERDEREQRARERVRGEGGRRQMKENRSNFFFSFILGWGGYLLQKKFIHKTRPDSNKLEEV